MDNKMSQVLLQKGINMCLGVTEAWWDGTQDQNLMLKSCRPIQKRGDPLGGEAVGSEDLRLQGSPWTTRKNPEDLWERGTEIT